jgi:hypothetical protein
MSAAQRLDNALHRALVRELVPEWADIPFFKSQAGGGPCSPAPVKRLGAAPDRDLIAELLTTDHTGHFDPAEIQQLWSWSLAGESRAADEVALRQLLWRAVFDDHLAEVNKHITQPPKPVPAPAPVSVPVPVPEKPAGPTWSPLKARLRRNATVRRLARSSAWRAVRETVRSN